jgi:hypothetical protein
VIGMSGSQPLDIQPVADDGLGALRVGLVLWVLAGAVLVVRRAELAEQANEWWLLTCVTAVVVGALNWVVFSARVANRQKPMSRSGESPTAEQPN